MPNRHETSPYQPRLRNSRGALVAQRGLAGTMFDQAIDSKESEVLVPERKIVIPRLASPRVEYKKWKEQLDMAGTTIGLRAGHPVYKTGMSLKGMVAAFLEEVCVLNNLSDKGVVRKKIRSTGTNPQVAMNYFLEAKDFLGFKETSYSHVDRQHVWVPRSKLVEYLAKSEVYREA